MPGILLTILKIIGIVLLVILGILILVILLVLFVPLRYRLHVKREEKDFGADGRMTWLLHLLRADLTYQDGSGIAVVRICGFKFKTFEIFGHGSHKEGDTAAGADLPAEDNADQAAVNAGPPEENEVPRIEEHFIEKDSESAGDNPEDTSPEPAISKKRAEGRKPSGKEKRRASQGSEKNTGVSERTGIIGRIGNLIARVIHLALELLLQIPGLPAEVYDRISRILDRISATTEGLSRKIDPVFSIEAEHMFEKGIRYLKFLIRGYAPRKITGYIHFGTGSPDLTGKLTGLIYVLLPESATEYDVDPDFYEVVLQTDTTAKGHIRMYRMAWVGIRLLLDKEFWILLRRIRGKDPAAKKHRFRGRKKKKAEEKPARKAA